MSVPILFVGQRRWCEHLVRVGQGGRVVGPLTLLLFSLWTKPKLIVRVGFRPGSKTWRGRAFDLVYELAVLLSRQPREVIYWIGSDVEDSSRLGMRPNQRVNRRAVHWAGSQNLSLELRRLGVQSKVVWFPDSLPDTTCPETLPSERVALTYVPASRQEFYGAREIVEVARLLPDVEFRVAGTSSFELDDVPANVTFMGWIDSFVEAIQAVPVVLRLPRHDAVGATAREALAYGRWLIYSQPLEGSIQVRHGDPEGLCLELDALYRQLDRTGYEPNAKGHQVFQESFGPSTRDRFRSELHKRLES